MNFLGGEKSQREGQAAGRARTRDRVVCDGEAAGPVAQGGGLVIRCPEGFKKGSDMI